MLILTQTLKKSHLLLISQLNSLFAFASPSTVNVFFESGDLVPFFQTPLSLVLYIFLATVLYTAYLTLASFFCIAKIANYLRLISDKLFARTVIFCAVAAQETSKVVIKAADSAEVILLDAASKIYVYAPTAGDNNYFSNKGVTVPGTGFFPFVWRTSLDLSNATGLPLWCTDQLVATAIVLPIAILIAGFIPASRSRPDSSSIWQRTFENPLIAVREKIVDLHHDIRFFLITATVFIFWITIRTLQFYSRNNSRGFCNTWKSYLGQRFSRFIALAAAAAKTAQELVNELTPEQVEIAKKAYVKAGKAGNFITESGRAYETTNYVTRFSLGMLVASAGIALVHILANKKDASSVWQRTFQNPATAIREKIVDLHHDIRFFLIVVVVFVSWILARTVQFYSRNSSRGFCNTWKSYLEQRFSRFIALAAAAVVKTFAEVVAELTPEQIEAAKRAYVGVTAVVKTFAEVIEDLTPEQIEAAKRAYVTAKASAYTPSLAFNLASAIIPPLALFVYSSWPGIKFYLQVKYGKKPTFKDASSDWQRTFQNPATAIREKIVDLHHDIRFFLIVVVVFVSWVTVRILHFYVKKFSQPKRKPTYLTVPAPQISSYHDFFAVTGFEALPKTGLLNASGVISVGKTLEIWALRFFQLVFFPAVANCTHKAFNLHCLKQLFAGYLIIPTNDPTLFIAEISGQVFFVKVVKNSYGDIINAYTEMAGKIVHFGSADGTLKIDNVVLSLTRSAHGVGLNMAFNSPTFSQAACGVGAAIIIALLFWLKKKDASSVWQRTFENPLTAVREKIVDLHHDIRFFLITATVFVSWITIRTLQFYSRNNSKGFYNTWKSYLGQRFSRFIALAAAAAKTAQELVNELTPEQIEIAKKAHGKAGNFITESGRTHETTSNVARFRLGLVVGSIAIALLDILVNKKDASPVWQRTFQNPATAIREKIVDLHHDIRFFLIVVVVFVSWITIRTLQFYSVSNAIGFCNTWKSYLGQRFSRFIALATAVAKTIAETVKELTPEQIEAAKRDYVAKNASYSITSLVLRVAFALSFAFFARSKGCTEQLVLRKGIESRPDPKKDASSDWQRTFQNPATAIRDKIADFHHDIRFFLIVVVVFVSWILARTVQFRRKKQDQPASPEPTGESTEKEAPKEVEKPNNDEKKEKVPKDPKEKEKLRPANKFLPPNIIPPLSIILIFILEILKRLWSDKKPPGAEIVDKTLEAVFSNYFLQTYYSLVLYLFLAAFICALLATLAYFFSLSAVQDSEKKSEYECGFEPFDSATRLPFDVHFYLVGILFLIFDVEIALLFPWVLSLKVAGWFGFYLRRGFILILAVGFLYEWKRGALIWPSRQQEKPYKAFSSSLGFAAVIVLPSTESRKAWSVSVTNTDYFLADQLVNYLLPEIFFITLVTYRLTGLALEFGRGTKKSSLAIFSLKASISGLALTLPLYLTQLFYSQPHSLFNGYALFSPFVSSRKLLVLLSCLLVLSNSKKYVETKGKPTLEYGIIFVRTVLFRRLVVGSSNFRAAFRTIVGFSLNLYVLILFGAADGGGREAGAKYYFLSTFSAGLRIYGVFILLRLVNTLQFAQCNQILSEYTELTMTTSSAFRVGLGLLLTGIFFKLSAFPGHLWAPEVYEGSPDPVTAFFRLPVKITVLAFLLSTLAVARAPISYLWQPLIAVATVGSLIWGALGALSEKSTKRFLAYASINQIGFLLLGLVTASFGGYQATLIYLSLYRVRNFGFLIIFLSARRLKYPARSGFLYLTDFRGLGQQNWLLSWSLARRLFSRAGIPPLAGFFGKYYLLLNIQQKKLYLLVRLPLLRSLPSAYYYLRVIKTLWFEGYSSRVFVECPVSPGAQATIFGSEGFLWRFVVFSGSILSLASSTAQSLIAPNA